MVELHALLGGDILMLLLKSPELIFYCHFCFLKEENFIQSSVAGGPLTLVPEVTN